MANFNIDSLYLLPIPLVLNPSHPCRLTWACQVLHNSSRRLEQMDDTQQHLVESLGVAEGGMMSYVARPTCEDTLVFFFLGGGGGQST